MRDKALLAAKANSEGFSGAGVNALAAQHAVAGANSGAGSLNGIIQNGRIAQTSLLAFVATDASFVVDFHVHQANFAQNLIKAAQGA